MSAPDDNAGITPEDRHDIVRGLVGVLTQTFANMRGEPPADNGGYVPSFTPEGEVTGLHEQVDAYSTAYKRGRNDAFDEVFAALDDALEAVRVFAVGGEGADGDAEPVTLPPLPDGHKRLWILRSDTMEAKQLAAFQNAIRAAYPDEAGCGLIALLRTGEDLTAFGVSPEVAAHIEARANSKSDSA